MRIARVLHAEAAIPTVALECDGALYDVAELDRHFDTRYSPERFRGASDFHTRVVALTCAGLAELDDALRSGRRPRAARLLPGTFTWMPPCATDRAAYIQLGPYRTDGAGAGDAGAGKAAAQRGEPLYWFGNARGMV